MVIRDALVVSGLATKIWFLSTILKLEGVTPQRGQYGLSDKASVRYLHDL